MRQPVEDAAFGYDGGDLDVPPGGIGLFEAGMQNERKAARAKASKKAKKAKKEKGPMQESVAEAAKRAAEIVRQAKEEAERLLGAARAKQEEVNKVCERMLEQAKEKAQQFVTIQEHRKTPPLETHHQGTSETCKPASSTTL